MMLTLGLTGSLAMGKSTTADIFRRFGVPVFDADAAVHQIYARGGQTVSKISSLFPEALDKGALSRKRLSACLFKDEDRLQKLEDILHPLIYHAEKNFFTRASQSGAEFAGADIPLIFETGRQTHYDKILVVTAPASLQQKRALKRKGMTEEKLSFLLRHQWPDTEKRIHADYILETSLGLKSATIQVQSLMKDMGIAIPS